MILTIDVGNTNIVLGGFVEDDLIFESRIATNPNKTNAEYATKIKSILTLNGIEKAEIKGSIISSVVPPLNTVLREAVNLAYNVEPIIVGPGIKTGINLLSENPSQIGADIICGCVAAYNLYHGPVLIIDMGTATKMIVVDENAALIGASIIPGVQISLNALIRSTAQLPQIGLDTPKATLAKNTVECMRSGVILGNASMLDGMIDRITEEFGNKLTVVATGGHSKMIVPHCKHKIILDSDLLLKGLMILYRKNEK